MSPLRHRITLGALGLTVAATLVGCVPAEQYAGMKMKADQYAEQLGHAQSDVNAANARADALQQQLNSINNGNATQTALLNNDQQTIEQLRQQNEQWNSKYAEAMRLASQAGDHQALPTQLNNELKDFADNNPELIDFDSSRGVVKFKSDVVFAAGDASVSASAKGVLSKFAAILASTGAEKYDLLVAGHTDNTPVVNLHTKQMGNFNNWYLSAHRAIAVGTELIADGVSAKRVGMVGYADQRPLADNGTADGKAQNRRVEVLILPRAGRSTAGYASTVHAAHKPRMSAEPAGEAQPAKAVLGKDGAMTPPPPSARAPAPATK